MLGTMSGLAANELIFVNGIDEVCDGKVIEKQSCIKFRMAFFTLVVKLAFAQLR